MRDHELSAEESRASWWRAQRNKFGLPDSLYAPLPIAIVLVFGLGVGSSLVGLFPGVNTHAVTVSGVGAPWIGLIVLLAIAGLWYWRVLHNGYSLLWMGSIVAIAVVIALLVNTLSLNTLVVEYPDAFIGGLGTVLLFGALLLFIGFLFENFALSVLMGAFMGMFLGVLAGFPIGLEAILMMVLINGSIGVLAGGIAGVLRPMLMRLRR